MAKMAGKVESQSAGRDGRHDKATGMQSPLVIDGDAVGLPHSVGDVVPDILDGADELICVGANGVVHDALRVPKGAETEAGATNGRLADGEKAEISGDDAGNWS